MRLSLLLLLLLTACQSSHQPKRFENTTMAMHYCVQIGDPLSYNQKKEIEEVIAATFEEINLLFNDYNPSSFLSYLNRLPAGERISPPSQFLHLIREIDHLVQITGGRFDPTVAPMQKLWKQALKEGKTPEQTEIEAISSAIGWHHLHIEEEEIWKDHPLTALDLGGVAKGYAVDLLIERLSTLGYHSIYVEWGGEIRALGAHPHKRPWRIAITGGREYELDNQAIATSGNYYQKWDAEGKTFSHIIDPHTLSPIESTTSTIISASVICEKCMTADALATALMLFPTVEDAREWADSHIPQYKITIIDAPSWHDPFPVLHPVP